MAVSSSGADASWTASQTEATSALSRRCHRGVRGFSPPTGDPFTLKRIGEKALTPVA